MTDKEMGKAFDKARRRYSRRVVAAQKRCADTMETAMQDYEAELDAILEHNHPVLNRQDG